MKLRFSAAVAMLICLYPNVSNAISSITRLITPPGYTSTTLYDGITIQVYMEANRSYVCTLAKPYSVDYEAKFAPAATIGSSQLAGKYIGNVSPVNVGGATGLINESRISFQPSESGIYSIGISSTLELESLSVSSGSVSCVETGLYGGFNTNASEYNFLELTNSTNAAVIITVRAVGSDGTVLVNNENITVEAGTRKDMDLHSLVGAGKYGTVVVTHDGPLGAIKAAVSQYKVRADGTTLPTQSLPLSTRTDVAAFPVPYVAY